MNLKVHQGGTWRCPGCRRSDVKPGSTHKVRRGQALWCDGQALPERDRAMALLALVHNTAAGLALEGRYAELVAYLSPLERA